MIAARIPAHLELVEPKGSPMRDPWWMPHEAAANRQTVDAELEAAEDLAFALDSQSWFQAGAHGR